MDMDTFKPRIRKTALITAPLIVAAMVCIYAWSEMDVAWAIVPAFALVALGCATQLWMLRDFYFRSNRGQG